MHVVLLPWLAFGHMIPYFQLSVVLAKAGIRVSFISTPRNIQRLPKVPPNLKTPINFVEIPLPHVDGLREGAEATVDIPLEDDHYLKKAYDLLQIPVEQFITKESLDWIICDAVPHWAVEICRKFGLSLAFVSIFSAAASAFIGPLEFLTGEGRKRVRSSPEGFLSPPDWFTFPSSVALLPHEAIGFCYGYFEPHGSGASDAGRYEKAVKNCDVFAVRSCNEFEGEYLELIGKLYNKPTIPMGSLLPEPPSKTTTKDGELPEIFKWLDEQAPSSVVFVAFGSESKLSRDEVYEIAHGLELSNLPFLWALRRPMWAHDEVDVLPLDFTNRIKGRGVVSMGWCAQLEILSHPSIGGSLLHCGWGSITETLQFGHVLVALPLILDQGANARLLVERGVAIEVERKEDGSFSGDAIAKCLRHAMIEEGGEKLRTKAREMKNIFGNRALQEQYERGFVEFLKSYRAK